MYRNMVARAEMRAYSRRRCALRRQLCKALDVR